MVADVTTFSMAVREARAFETRRTGRRLAVVYALYAAISFLLALIVWSRIRNGRIGIVGLLAFGMSVGIMGALVYLRNYRFAWRPLFLDELVTTAANFRKHFRWISLAVVLSLVPIASFGDTILLAGHRPLSPALLGIALSLAILVRGLDSGDRVLLLSSIVPLTSGVVAMFASTSAWWGIFVVACSVGSALAFQAALRVRTIRWTRLPQ